MNHADAYALLLATRPAGAGRRAARLVQAVTWHETAYGLGWRNCPGMMGAHNWGAIQGEPSVECGDKHADGSAYVAPFRIYPTDAAGAAAVWQWLWSHPTTRRVLMDDAVDAWSLARAMKRDGYYEATVASYEAALWRALDDTGRTRLACGACRIPPYVSGRCSRRARRLRW